MLGAAPAIAAPGRIAFTSPTGNIRCFIAKPFGTPAAACITLTPARAADVREGLPPFLIFYADKDMIGCDKAPSEAFCKALTGKKVQATTKEIANSNHIKIIVEAGTADTEVSKAIVEFVRKHTK